MEWIITIKKEYIDKILKGTKRYEIRKKVPKELHEGDVIYICEKGTKGKIVARFEVGNVSKWGRFGAWQIKGKFLGINTLEYFNYVGGHEFVYLIGIENQMKVESEFNITMLGLKKSPQWFAKEK